MVQCSKASKTGELLPLLTLKGQGEGVIRRTQKEKTVWERLPETCVSQVQENSQLTAAGQEEAGNKCPSPFPPPSDLLLLNKPVGS